MNTIDTFSFLRGSLLVFGVSVFGLGSSLQATEPCLADPEDSLAQLEETLFDLYRQVDRVQESLPSENFNIQARQRLLGDDPQLLFTWVRDQTVALPYDGALRGGRGVLMDRGGSSLDRSLLLADLLEHAGYPVRLARSELTSEQRQLLVATAAAASIPALDSAEPDLHRHDETELAERFGLDPSEIDHWSGQGDEASERLAQAARALVEPQFDALVGELDPADPALELDWQPGEHWWVQYLDNGNWIDLDPSLPRHNAGDRLASAPEETFAPTDLPDNRFHRLTIRVIAEQDHGPQIEEHVALAETLATATLHGTPVRLNLQPQGLASPAAMLADPDDVQRLAEAIYSRTEWTPVLMVGEDTRVDRSILSDGSTRDLVDRPAQAQAMQEAAGALGGIGVRGRQRADPDTGPELSAVFVEFLVSAPGRADETFRRPLMDVRGASQRSPQDAASIKVLEWTDRKRRDRAIQMLSGVEILAQSNWWPASYSIGYLLHGMQKNRLSALGIVQAIRRFDNQSLGRALEHMQPASGALIALAFQRHAQSAQPQRIALTRINLMTEFEQFRLVDDEPVLAHGFDIIDNRIEVIGDGDDPRRVRLHQGILDTALEALLLQSADEVANASLEYQKALTAGLGWIDTDSLDNLDRLDPDAARQIREATRDGQVVLLAQDLATGARPHWWRLDPTTGTILGMGPDGRGSALVESLLVELNAMNNAVSAAAMVRSVWNCIFTAPTAMDTLCCTAMAGANWGMGQLLGYVGSQGAQMVANAKNLSKVYLAALNKIISDANSKAIDHFMPEPCEGGGS